jgi:hypothetical protein
MRCRSLTLLVLCPLLLASCGGGAGENLPVVPASGKVTYMGAALDGATLVFAPADGKHVGTALSGSDGAFSITMNNQSGALPGTYKVLVTKMLFSEPKLAPGEHVPTPGESKSLIPEKYGKLESTDLSVTIPEAGTDAIVVDVK